MKERLANMDLLRIIAMLMVLLVHADFAALGAPEVKDWQVNPYGVVVRYVVEMFAIVGVDVFVLLSGWFGIHFKVRKLSELLFQVFFYSFGFFLAFAIIKGGDGIFSLEGIKSIFLFNSSDYWFIKAYVALYLLSPFLNSFCEKATKKELSVVLVLYLLFHIIYGWIEDASVHFTMNGTTGLSFVALYLMGRYIKLYPCCLMKMNKWNDLYVYIVISILLAVCCIVSLCLRTQVTLSSRIMSYGNPLIWISSIALVLFFSKLQLTNRIVSQVGISCLAVYLFHCNYFFFRRYYLQLIREWISDGRIMMVGFYITMIYLVAILLDKIRLNLWNRLLNVVLSKQ